MPGYAELQVCSNYSFLRGASRIEKLLLQAQAVAITTTPWRTLPVLTLAPRKSASA